WNAGEAPGVLRRDRLREIGDRKPGQNGERGACAYTGDADELAKGAALLEAGKAVERMSVFAHDEMGVERDGLARSGQPIERAHRHVELVAHAAHVEEHLRRGLSPPAD